MRGGGNRGKRIPVGTSASPAENLTHSRHSRRGTAVTAMLLAKSPVSARPGHVRSRTWQRPAPHPEAGSEPGSGASCATTRIPYHSSRDARHGGVTNPRRGRERCLTPIWARGEGRPVPARGRRLAGPGRRVARHSVVGNRLPRGGVVNVLPPLHLQPG